MCTLGGGTKLHPVTTHKASAGVMRTLLQLAQQTRALTAGPQLARALTAGPQLARAFTAGPQLARAFTAGPHTLEGHGVKALLLVSKRGMAFCSTEVTEHGTHDKVRARDPGTGSGPASPPPLPPQRWWHPWCRPWRWPWAGTTSPQGRQCSCSMHRSGRL